MKKPRSSEGYTFVYNRVTRQFGRVVSENKMDVAVYPEVGVGKLSPSQERWTKDVVKDASFLLVRRVLTANRAHDEHPSDLRRTG